MQEEERGAGESPRPSRHPPCPGRWVFSPYLRLSLLLRCLMAARSRAISSASASASASSRSRCSSDLCQDFGHESSRPYAAIGTVSDLGAVRSKNAPMASAGTLYPMVECGLLRL